MRRPALVVAALLCGTSAQATTLDFGVAYPGWARTEVSDFLALGGKGAGGISNRALDFSYSRGLSLPPLGAANISSQVQLAWEGGVRLSSTGSVALGPVALKVSAAYFTAPRSTFDPLADWTQTPSDTRSSGWNGNLNVRYRLNRQWVGVIGGEFGPQNNGFIGAETHRDLTRTLPSAQGDDPAAPRETVSSGSLTYRAGVRAEQGVLGAAAGITYTNETDHSVTLDAQVGPSRNGHSGLGVQGSVTLPAALGQDSSLKLYAAYEPWRENAAYLRAGIEASRPLGPGVFTLNVRGGATKRIGLAAGTGLGISAGYSFVLGGETAQP